MAKYYSTKTYGTDRGLSCCFRQWRATHSHCSTLHGYSIGIRLVFEADTLDDRNWVFDFGGLKQFKEWAEHMFDHTLVIAEDDPHLDFFQQMAAISNGSQSSDIPHERGALCDLRIVPAVGCEMFAKMCYDAMLNLLEQYRDTSNLYPVGKTVKIGGRYPIGETVRLRSVEVFEHAGNSAIYEG
jgi:6-pyruvoyltetrahydropterin/6-carboxytetrahydropterin synthase